ncbi:restriction endonuclease subunit S [Pseudomonas aeruginosa]|nr:restriction endonuclease subunit S [Pseudomonas aeruginosa]
MTAFLTDNLPLLTGAPNGAKKLRELILQLAVMGKLVPQDPSDEPASELLKRIAEGKARLVAEGKIKRQKPRAHITETEAPFDLPKDWQWARLGDLSELITSGSRDWAQHYSNEGAIFVRMGNLSRGSYELRLNSIQRVSPPENGEGSRTKLEPGDLLLSITGDVGLLGLIPENFGEAYINQHVCLIRFISSVRGRFLPEALRSPLAYKQYEAPQRGIKNSFRLGDVSDILVPLPPLAEQHRIVAKVDELMALCDRLEAQQADTESAHTQLVQALLDSLAQSSDADEFAANWKRLAEHFHTLFTTESSIDALKQTLLQLAVMGKLVPQHPNDEPASELLKRIAEEKSRLVTEGKIKRQKPLPEINEEDKPFQLPKSWIWTRLGNLAGLITSGSRDWAQHYSEEGAVFVRMGNLSRRSYELRLNNIQRVSPPEDGEGSRTKLEAGDLLISITGEVGLLGLIPDGFGEAYINQHVCLVRFVRQLQGRFLPEILRSPLAYDQYEAPQRGIKNSFRLTDVSEMLVPLPPLSEQHRIVAKVDQLMALCDQLKIRLAQARQLNEQLASTLVEQAVA